MSAIFFLYAGLCVGVAVITFVLTGAIARLPFLLNPVTERSNHDRPTSRAGGVVLIAVVLGVIAVMVLLNRMGAPPLWTLMALCAGILGAIDDFSPLSAFRKLIVLLGICIMVVYLTGPMCTIPLPVGGVLELPAYIGYPISVFFILAFVNAFNFMDGLNGIAASVAIVGLGIIVAIGAGGSLGLVLLCVVIAGALYGFTIRNVTQGTIFLGDSGSLSIGVFLSSSALWSAQSDPMLFYVFIIGFIPYLADTGFTLVLRWRRGASLLEPHKEHFYQRLIGHGWSHQAVALYYLSATLIGGGLGYLAWRTGSATMIWAAAFGVFVIYGLGLRQMFKRAAEPS